MNRFSLVLAATAVIATGACKKTAGSAPSAGAAAATVAVTPPADGDWSKMTIATKDGGFVIGNPNAQVKLVEYGSMTCPHCARFDALGGKPLIDNYVKGGKVSWEYRNFVRDPYDVTAALVARCNGPSSFFGLTRALYASQRDWIGKIQAVPPAELQGLEALPPQQQFSRIAGYAGFAQFAALRGVPVAKTNACLANAAEVSKLVQMNGDAVSQYNIAGTPTFLINGATVDLGPVTEEQVWPTLETKLKAAMGG